MSWNQKIDELNGRVELRFDSIQFLGPQSKRPKANNISWKVKIPHFPTSATGNHYSICKLSGYLGTRSMRPHMVRLSKRVCSESDVEVTELWCAAQTRRVVSSRLIRPRVGEGHELSEI